MTVIAPNIDVELAQKRASRLGHDLSDFERLGGPAVVYLRAACSKCGEVVVVWGTHTRGLALIQMCAGRVRAS